MSVLPSLMAAGEETEPAGGSLRAEVGKEALIRVGLEQGQLNSSEKSGVGRAREALFGRPERALEGKSWVPSAPAGMCPQASALASSLGMAPLGVTGWGSSRLN